MRIYIICIFLMLFAGIDGYSQMLVNDINIGVYLPETSDMAPSTYKILETKLNQIVTECGIGEGFNKRFVLTAKISDVETASTSTIPQKSASKVNIMLYIGDGISGNLYNSLSIELRGVGKDYIASINSAIRKLSCTSDIKGFVESAKDKIKQYYENNASGIIMEAESFKKAGNYEDAVRILSEIPPACSKYPQAIDMITDCTALILDRNNQNAIRQAYTAWDTNPTVEGAHNAQEILEAIQLPNKKDIASINQLQKEINRHLTDLQNQEFEIYKQQLLSETETEIARVNASAQITSSIFESLPSIIFNVVKWF